MQEKQLVLEIMLFMPMITLRPDMIWDIVIKDIPILKEEVNAFLSEN